MIEDSNGIGHCYPEIGLGICKLPPSSFHQYYSRFSGWVRTAIFQKPKLLFLRHLLPLPKFQKNKTYQLLDLEESSTYINWSHQTPKGCTVRNKNKSSLPQSITWIMIFYCWSSFSKPKMRKKKNLCHLLHLADQLTLKWGWGTGKKCCIHINRGKFKSMLHVSNAYCPKRMSSLLNKATDFCWL